MKLTDKELEIMAVLWRNSSSMTATEIIEVSNNRTWKEQSIYIIMNTLLEKGAVILAQYKPTMTKKARAYKPAITSEEYAISSIRNMNQIGIKVDIDALIECLMKTKDG